MRTSTAHIAMFLVALFYLTAGVVSVSAAEGMAISAETTALLLLLPIVATMVSVMHYVLGISGYGIFMPTMMAVVMMSTGVGGGLILFAGILAISVLSNLVLKKLKLHFWPGRSMGLMMIAIMVIAMMKASTYFGNFDIKNMSIYPVLFMVLLSEEFVRTQLSKSKKEAVSLTVGTLVLAIAGAVVLKADGVQNWVLRYPGMTILLVIVTNIIVGNYKGIRLSEIKRFKNAIRKK